MVSRIAAITFDRLKRPLPIIDGIVPTELFPLRNEVDDANKIRLNALKTRSHAYESRDTGAANEERRTKIFQNMIAQRILEIKVGAQVMLIKNVDEELVNGSIGKVLGFHTVSEVCGSGGNISSKAGNGFIRDALLKDDRGTPEECGVAERKSPGVKQNLESGLRDSGERFPLVEFWTSTRKEAVLVGRSEFKVEENDGTVAAKRVQVGIRL